MRYLVDEDELYHWARGEQSKNHKYVKREKKNGKWVYYYSDAHTSGSGAHAENYKQWASEMNRVYNAQKEVAETATKNKKAQTKGMLDSTNSFARNSQGGSATGVHTWVKEAIDNDRKAGVKNTSKNVKDFYKEYINPSIDDYVKRAKQQAEANRQFRDKVEKGRKKIKRKKHAKTTARMQTK